MFSSSLPPVVCSSDHVLFTFVCLFAHSGVKHILCCVFVWVFHSLMSPMLPVSLDCPGLISSSVLSYVYLKA